MPVKVEERERDIRLMWERDPNGPVLLRDRAPPGQRTENGFVWGHKLGHIFWIQRIPGQNAVTVWSRSMLKELGEGYDESQWDEPLVGPRVRRPWPVLTHADDIACAGNGTLYPEDCGCEVEHSQLWKPPAGWKQRPETVLSPAWLAFLGECPDDEQEMCTGPMLPNVGPEPLRNARGEVYDYLLCEHFKAFLKSSSVRFIPKDQDLIMMIDPTGLCIYAPPQTTNTADEGGSETQDSALESTAIDAPQAVRDTDVVLTDSAVASKKEKEGLEEGEILSGKPPVKKMPPPENIFPRNPFLVKGLPKLEEFIPDKYLPDVLMVHDPDNVTTSKGDPFGAIKYKRYYPTAEAMKEKLKSNESGDATPKENVAHLYLTKVNRLGSGNHSFVYRAPLTLPSPLSARSPSGQVTVAAKLAHNRCSAHTLLKNEARVYNELPKHAQEEYCGYNVVPQCRFPVPVSAIAPKFFGYYVPLDENGDFEDDVRWHSTCREDEPCAVRWPSPILLMEECGQPVEPESFTADQRTECFSLVLRLHAMDFAQGSFYVRNIMCQPGPLTLPPEKRSYDTPSFRIIDFGRGYNREWDMDAEDKRKRAEAFARRTGDEIGRARDELLIEEFGF